MRALMVTAVLLLGAFAPAAFAQTGWIEGTVTRGEPFSRPA